MTAWDHDLVPPVAADASAINLPVSPPRRDPVEDADASFTRKRPRLDCGSSALRAMSTDPASPTLPTATAAAAPHEQPVEMTIRPHPSSSPVAASDERPGSTHGASRSNSPAPPRNQSPIAISSSDDGSGSPPVEIVMDDDTLFTVHIDADDHFHNFPFNTRNNCCMVVRELITHIEKASTVEPHVIPALTRWLTEIPSHEEDAAPFFITKDDFWKLFADLVTAVLHRRNPLGDKFDDRDIEDTFSEFLTAYVRVCSTIFLVDAHRLSRTRSEELFPYGLLSEVHIRHATTLLRREKVPLYHLLHKDYAIDTLRITTQIQQSFISARGAQNLLRLAHEAFQHVERSLENEIALQASRSFSALGWVIHASSSMAAHLSMSDYCRQVVGFFYKYGSDLFDLNRITDSIIARELIVQHAELVSELCIWDSDIAAELVRKHLDFRDIQASGESPIEHDASIYRQDPTAFPALASNAWRFKVLRKYVTKGRMDLRVLSIAAMDAVLVEIWKELGGPDSDASHPVLQYLADFLLKARVVDYIVSVDSHPQLISRSANIVGFLIVTHRWSDGVADTVWNTIANSPDSRVVSATIVMLRNIVGLMASLDLLHLCKKMYELSIERYTQEILVFLRELSLHLNAKSPRTSYTEVDHEMRPWNVCVRMIRDAAPSRDSDKELSGLYTEACEQLHSLLPLIPEEERHAIYRDCAQHIANHTRHATGSVRVIHLLAAPSQVNDGPFFEENVELSRQILQEIPHLVQSETATGPYPWQKIVLQCRIELLALFICRAALAISADLYNDIWHYTVGPGAHSDAARNIAWVQFLHTIRVVPRNDFCEKLMSSYVPIMDPRCFTDGLFEFVANCNFPTSRVHSEPEDSTSSILQNPGYDLLWLLMTESVPESPIGDRAARLLATRYAKMNETAGFHVAEVEAAHVAIVEKCIEELRGTSKAARNEALCSGRSEIRCQKILLFLKLLLESIRQQPELNRTRRADSKVDEADVPVGCAIAIKYQCGNDRQSVSMAADHTLDDLYKRLCHATNFSKINLFAKGQRLNLVTSGSQKLSDLDFGGQLLIQRAEGAEATRPLLGSRSGTSVFETTLLEYFDELFELMESEDAISQMLFDFLTFFPHSVTFTDMVMSGKAQSETLFPPGKSFQARYAARALQAGLLEQIHGSNLSEQFLANAVHHLNAALLNPRLMSDPISSFQELRLAAIIVHVLLEFLRGMLQVPGLSSANSHTTERPSADVSATYFSDGGLLATRLVGILSVALENNEEAVFVQDTYAAILEASLHSRIVWNTFTDDDRTPGLHHALLLSDSRPLVREHVARKIASVCGGDLPSTCPISKATIASHFWGIICNIVPATVKQPERSQQLFGVAEHVFRANDEYEREEHVLRTYLACWSELLLSYESQTFAGRDETDFVIFGFTKLMLGCILSIKSFKKPLNMGALMEQIYRKFLFAAGVSTPDSTTSMCQVLDSPTRHEVYELVLALADDKIPDPKGSDDKVTDDASVKVQIDAGSSYSTLLDMALWVERRTKASSMASISVDRSLEVRSSTGYVGLYNPRNICYMNSLLTQLFMNSSFRRFFLSLEVQEASGSQKLLAETQRLFTQMQQSVSRSADPREFAACITTFEQTPIDVSVQMDVDEFFNLLFDQWEKQLVKEEDKQKFRSFYGGQTLNQIKSKECDHVSERTESFFTVQCDVQGKSSLKESLGAFIKGDVMEGDNKYKCEACGGKLVDAVKRTCLKDVPDNLILHLKRFDFDLSDWSRRKIYDHFEFPESFDMSDYHVDHLSDPSKPREKDIFDLVGILVHSGTCESGHYYSYIRERPSPMGPATPSWVEFDDSNVTPFSPADIPQRAFGGPTDDAYNRHFKVYSAYMLFYQRRKTVERNVQDGVAPTLGRPFTVPAPQALVTEVDTHNSDFIREYCLFDPSHSKFIRQLHALSRTINKGTCSEHHNQENRALQTVLLHQTRIVWRSQAPEIFMETISQLRRSVLSCQNCCYTVLQFLTTDDHGLMNLLLRCQHAKVRSETRGFLVDCLRFLRDKEPSVYGVDNADSDTDMDTNVQAHGLLTALVAKLRWIAEDSALNTRAWDDLYLTMSQIADMGHAEIAVFLDHGLLEFCARLFCMHSYKQFQEDVYDLARVMSGKRKGIYNGLIIFFTTLLLQTDIELPTFSLPSNTLPDSRNRLALLDRERLKFPMTYFEKQIMTWYDHELIAIAVLDKVFEQFDPAKDSHFYPADMVKWMMASRDPSVYTHLFRTLVEGVGIDAPYCNAYIRAGLPFCEQCTNPEHVQKYLGAVAKGISSLARIDAETAPSGDVVLDLLAGLLTIKNEALFQQRHPHIFHQYLMVKSRFYAAPLLMHTMESIRKGAQIFLLGLFLDHGELPSEMLVVKWRAIRELISELSTRVMYESNSGILRSHMSPLISTCQSLIQSLFILSQSEDPDMDQYKDENDVMIFQRFRSEVESRLHSWPDEGTPPSTIETLDQSDYGSESDDPQDYKH